MAAGAAFDKRERGESRESMPIDVHVGARVRMRRKMLGFSQQALAEILGITFQQVQKYERGANRIGASRLHELSKALDAPVAFFFDDADPVYAPPSSDAPDVTEVEGDPLKREETIDLVDSYYQIGEERARRCLFNVARVLAGDQHTRGRGRPRS
jgi:transcriptional regulator with XRE-family HTH domain